MKKSSMEEMHLIASKKSGKCLSTIYINSQTPLLWKCNKGHIWKARPNNIKGGTWCPTCAGTIPRKIEEAHSIASKRKGKCLSEKMQNTKSPLLWQCELGHVWKALFSNVRRGAWCDKCARRASADKRRGNIEEIQKIAKQRGGKCLSKVYKNAHSPLLFACDKGHKWKTAPNNVRRGKWCKSCSSSRASIKYSINDAIQIAEKRGGKCLTSAKEYINSTSKIKWQCNKGHIWLAALTNILRYKSWCPKCGIQSSTQKRLKPIIEIHKLAKEKAGKCLVDSHSGVDKKIPWKCSLGHTWLAKPSQVKRGSWCPHCSSHLGERICRSVLEQLFQTKFPKKRPFWLQGENGERFELDGFSEKLKIAFEHHGVHHYKINRKFSKTKQALQKRQEFDEIKLFLCKSNNVKVIIIPEVFQLTKLENLCKIIRDECIKKKIPLPEDFDQRAKNLDLSIAYKSPISLTQLKQIQKIAISRGGECLSQVYITNFTKMKFKCSQGHIFETIPNNIKRGIWCNECGGTKCLTIEEMKQLAISRGGECLSTTYKNAHIKLTWKCSKGHIWKQTTNAIKHSGYWCPQCAIDNGKSKKKGTIEEMQNLAKEKGGICISKTYTNSKISLKWQCKKGHFFFLSPGQVKEHKNRKGQWCSICKNK